MRDLAKVIGLSLGLKLAQVEEQLTHAQQQLRGLEAKGRDPQAQAALPRHSLTATVTPPVFETDHAWASDLVGQFQRASSAVEGRNGYLSQRNHCARGTLPQRLKVMTVIRWWSGWPPCPCPESQEHPQNLTH